MQIRTKLQKIKKYSPAIFAPIAVISLFLLTLNVQPAEAQGGGFNIEVSPGKINVAVEPGQAFSQTFRIGNFSGTTQTLFIYVEDFTVVNEEGTPTFFPNGELDEEASRFALSQWVELPTDSLTLENNQVTEIEALIDVPADAEAGGHYGAFFVQTDRPEAEGTNIGSIGRIASLMLVNVPGDVAEEIVIDEAFTVKPIYFEENPEIEFVTMLENKGNVHGIPVGAFSITGGIASKQKSVIYNQNQGAVLPGAPIRRISETFTLEKEGLVPPMGKFTIDLISRYGTENLPLETTIFFWLIPAKFIAISVLIALIVLFVIWRALVSFRR